MAQEFQCSICRRYVREKDTMVDGGGRKYCQRCSDLYFNSQLTRLNDIQERVGKGGAI